MLILKPLIEHAYYTQKIVFPDGRVISGSAEKLTTPPTLNDFKIWTDDVYCVLNHITVWNSTSSDPFYTIFDTTRIGILGHSYGGMVAFELCAKDPRFKAGINLDAGWLSEAITIDAIHKPFMFIMAEQSIANLYLSDEEMAEKLGQPREVIQAQQKDMLQLNVSMREVVEKLNEQTSPSCIIIPGLEHMGFSDLLILKEFPIYKNNKHIIDLEQFTGVVEGFYTMQTLNKHIVQFFNRFLR